MGVKPQGCDQFYIFAQQLHWEDTKLRHVDFVVVESPLLMNSAYSQFYHCPYTRLLIEQSRCFDLDFPPLNFFIDRTVQYNPKGRYQSHTEALEFDQFLLRFLDQNLVGSLNHITVNEVDKIIAMIGRAINGCHCS
jgi:hypothetical protein